MRGGRVRGRVSIARKPAARSWPTAVSPRESRYHERHMPDRVGRSWRWSRARQPAGAEPAAPTLPTALDFPAPLGSDSDQQRFDPILGLLLPPGCQVVTHDGLSKAVHPDRIGIDTSQPVLGDHVQQFPPSIPAPRYYRRQRLGQQAGVRGEQIQGNRIWGQERAQLHQAGCRRVLGCQPPDRHHRYCGQRHRIRGRPSLIQDLLREAQQLQVLTSPAYRSVSSVRPLVPVPTADHPVAPPTDPPHLPLELATYP